MTTATESTISQEELDQLCVNTIRFLAIDGVQKANSGHPGAPMGLASVAYTIFTKHLRFNPKNPDWAGRDRFILSNGHASMLLYSLLHLTGYDLPLEELKQFRQWGSKTPGHPEYGWTPGVEITTGPLGAGFSTGVGMGIAQKFLSNTFDPSGHGVLDYNIYAICSDGDLEEGVASEAASIAGHLELDNLIYLYDDNHISIEGDTVIAFTENVSKRFEAYGWDVQYVADGNDLEAINSAIETAKNTKGKPHFIQVRTHIGYGSPNRQDSAKAHGSPLGKDEIKLTKENLKWPLEPDFYEPEEALAHFRQSIERGAALEAEWKQKFEAYQQAEPEVSKKLVAALNKELVEGWDADLPNWEGAKDIATRAVSGEILQKLAPKIPTLIGGSADLAESTNTSLEEFGSFEPSEAKGGSWTGRTMHYGVREHGMGSVINGMTLSKAIWAYGATFLMFADYMRPTIRLAALMGIPSIFIFTHDSVGLGEDGPTHQPIEHLMALRAIPNVTVLRPADANETNEAWRFIIQHKTGPSVLILTRQKLPVLDQKKYTPATELHKGGYILSEAEGAKPEVILIATGSEVSLALDAQKKLVADGVATRVVSIPSLDLFQQQSEEYQQQVLPDEVPARLSIELGISSGWERYVGSNGAALSIDHFGASAPFEIILEKFGFTTESVVRLAKLVISDPKAARREIKELQTHGLHG
ncbi:MAG: transketolase [Chloroflexota bacterium]|nr:transketolase [Chloroflexota bacterium]